jgi:hypothetical protein
VRLHHRSADPSPPGFVVASRPARAVAPFRRRGPGRNPILDGKAAPRWNEPLHVLHGRWMRVLVALLAMPSTDTAEEPPRPPPPPKLRRWFLAGAEVLAEFYPGLTAGTYACPLCRAPFTLDDLDAKVLTREHVPPKSIGGHPMVLTCKSCNNQAGYSFDAHMERAEAVRRFSTDDPLRPLDATITVADMPFRATIHGGREGMLILGIPKQNNPADLDAMFESFGDRLGEGHEMHVAFRDTFRIRTVQLGYVRAAYLAAFACLGYAYIFRPALDPIRDALNGNDDGSLVLPVLTTSDGSADRRAIGLVSEPSWLAGAVLVVIGPVAVVLPTVDTPGDPLAEFAERHDRPGALQGTFTTSPAFDWPTGPHHHYDRWLIAQRRPVGPPNPPTET